MGSTSLTDVPAAGEATPTLRDVPRLASAGPETGIARFDDPALLAAGKVNIISLEAVMERFATRWALRRDQVYDHVDRIMQGRLGDRGYFLRASETDYLICQPELGRFSGQAACLRYLREILGHFLGEAHLADIGVRAVTKISGQGIESQQVNAHEVESAEVAEAEERRSAEAAQQHSVDEWSPFVAVDGRSIRVSCSLDPVYELKTFGQIGFRLVRRVLDAEETLTHTAMAHLARQDILRIDLATIARGLNRLRAEVSAGQPLSLIIPVSYTSLSSQRGRVEIVNCFKGAQELVQRGIICELSDIEGVPQSSLLSAVSLIRPFALFVIGSVKLMTPSDIARLKGTGFQALALGAPAEIAEPEFDTWAQTAISAARQVTRSVLIYGANTSRNAGMAALLGATHASLSV
jgi:hypothetical protein